MKKEGQNDEWSRKGRDESGAKADGCAGKEGAQLVTVNQDKENYDGKYEWTDRQSCNFSDTKEIGQMELFSPDPITLTFIPTLSDKLFTI